MLFNSQLFGISFFYLNNLEFKKCIILKKNWLFSNILLVLNLFEFLNEKLARMGLLTIVAILLPLKITKFIVNKF